MQTTKQASAKQEATIARAVAVLLALVSPLLAYAAYVTGDYSSALNWAFPMVAVAAAVAIGGAVFSTLLAIDAADRATRPY